MRYHNITKDDMLNGEGLRVVLWVAGCTHKCKNCQNPETWDINGGIPFDSAAKEELFEALNKDYISGITFSGGDPFERAEEFAYMAKAFKNSNLNGSGNKNAKKNNGILPGMKFSIIFLLVAMFISMFFGALINKFTH